LHGNAESSQPAINILGQRLPRDAGQTLVISEEKGVSRLTLR
jgi:hypothetical protein